MCYHLRKGGIWMQDHSILVKNKESLTQTRLTEQVTLQERSLKGISVMGLNGCFYRHKKQIKDSRKHIVRKQGFELQVTRNKLFFFQVKADKRFLEHNELGQNLTQSRTKKKKLLLFQWSEVLRQRQQLLLDLFQVQILCSMF